jgi:hypothetical protein
MDGFVSQYFTNNAMAASINAFIYDRFRVKERSWDVLLWGVGGGWFLAFDDSGMSLGGMFCVL